MVRRAEVPKDIVKAIQRAWPDGVVEMIDLDEVPVWGSYAALKARLSRIRGSDLTYEREAGGGPTRSYHLFFLSPSDPHCSFETDTLEPDEDGVERRFPGQGRVGHTVAVSLAAPFALVALNQFETFENGSRSEPGIDFQVFDLDGKRLDAEGHYLELFGKEGMRILADQRARIARTLEDHGISVLPEEHLDTPLPGLRAAEDVLQGSPGGPLTVRDAFFFETV